MFDPPLFTYQYVTVRNNGNDLATIQGASYPNTTDWSATIDNTPLTLAPGQTTNLKIMQLTPADYDLERLDIKVAYNNTVSTDFVTVDANKRIITLIPSSTVIPSFTGSSNTKQVTVRNDGNTALSVTSVTSSNSRFSASPGSFTIQPGLEQTVTITYTPTDFSSQSSTITFNSNRTSGGNTLSISGQRTMSYSLYTYPLSLVIKPSAQIQSSTITNNGNVNATINSVSNSNTAMFTVSVRRYQSGTWVATSLPYTLTPGQQLNIEVKSANGSFSSATGYVTVTPNQGSSYQINIARSPTP